MEINDTKKKFTANQDQFRNAGRTMQIAGDEVEKVGDIALAAMHMVKEVQHMFEPVEPALSQMSASGQAATHQYEEAVNTLFTLMSETPNIHLMEARNYGSVILDVLQGRAEQNLPSEFTEVVEQANAVLSGLAMIYEGLRGLRRAATTAEDTVALIAGIRPHTGGHPLISPDGLTHDVLNETSAFIAKL